MHDYALGNRLIFLNTAEAVAELLERRSATTSSRPRMMMLGEL